MVNVVSESAIRRIFCTRGSSTVGADGRDRVTAGGSMPPSGVVAFVPFVPTKLSREFKERTDTSSRDTIGLNASEGELLEKSPSAGGSDLIIVVRRASVAVVEAWSSCGPAMARRQDRGHH